MQSDRSEHPPYGVLPTELDGFDSVAVLALECFQATGEYRASRDRCSCNYQRTSGPSGARPATGCEPLRGDAKTSAHIALEA
jgi:hypothetical protein